MTETIKKIRELAQKIYDYSLSNRNDNLEKNGRGGNPRNVGCEYEKASPRTQDFYNKLAVFYLTYKEEKEVCSCIDFKNATQCNVIFYQNNNFKVANAFNGLSFCPWCGNKLKK